jgi:pullulanase
VENSFASPDSVNAIDWSLKTAHRDVLEYVKALIKIRKAHPAFRMINAEDIAQHIRFTEKLPESAVAYEINGAAVKDPWSKIFIVYNGSAAEAKINLPSGSWQRVSLPGELLYAHKKKEYVIVSGYSCAIFYK